MNIINLPKFFVVFAFGIFIGLLFVGFVSAAPPDNDNNGCISLSEISSYVSLWLSGSGVTLSQVSGSVSLWLNGCTPASGGSLHSAAQTLTWPPPVTNTEFVGAEFNPTGNPIGGFYGYDRIVNPNDADYIITSRQQFIDLFDMDDYNNQQVQPGDIIYVDDNVEINLTGVWHIYIPANVTLASGRGRGFSKGALIYNHEQKFGPEAGRTFLDTLGPGVRITGLRIEGPDQSTQRVRHSQIFYNDPPRADNISGSYYDMGISVAFQIRYPYVEVDNCEWYGWSYTLALGYATPEYGGTVPIAGWGSAQNTYIHHNYIHHNPHAGLGYGVSVGSNNETYPITGLIEANLFDFNRHSVASTNQKWSSYEARYNLVLPESIAIPFDRHGGGGLAGLYTIVHHNTDRFMKENRGSVGISNPGYPPGVARAYNNWVYMIRPLEAIGNNEYPGQIEIFGNYVNPFPSLETSLPIAELTIDKDDVKIGESITFSASSSIGGTYGLSYACWNFGDRTEEVCGFADDAKTHSYSQPGRYLVTLKVVDVKGIFAETTKSVIVKPSNPNAIILSFWIRDSYNEHNTNDASGYFNKQVLIDNDVVWQRDVNSDGWGWEHVVVDITPYVEDTSVVDFQVRSLQNYQRQNYPSYHPFEFFELYLDDIYIFDRDYSVENFGDWEADSLGSGITYNMNGRFDGDGITHFYNNGGENWWGGSVMYDDKVSGGYSFMITSGYRENSIAGSTRGIKQVIKAPKTRTYLDVVNNFGTFRDISSYQLPVTFAGTKDASNNDVLDFYGYSKKFNGLDNYVSVSNFDLSRDYLLDLNVFLPYQNTQQTLMYATNGTNFVHIYYSANNNVIVKTNSVETTCSLPLLSHNNFNKILVGRSCNGATCTLSCASNGVISSFTNNNAVMTLAGTSSVSFGGYVSGTTNMFGAINRARILKGSVTNAVFINESKSLLQGAWYFRDGTNGIIQDGSLNNIDIDLPVSVSFGSEAQRKFIQFNSAGPAIIIPRNSSFKIGEEFSIEITGRFDTLDDDFNLISGLPYWIYNSGYTDPGYPSNRRLNLLFKLSQPVVVGDGTHDYENGVRGLHMLEDNKWYHFAFVKEGDYLNAYLNGVIDRKVYVPGAPYDNSIINDLIIGYFDGDIQRLSIYDNALTASEINALYKSSSLGCSDSDNDGYGVFPRSGVVNGCRLNGFDCNDANSGVGSGGC